MTGVMTGPEPDGDGLPVARPRPRPRPRPDAGKPDGRTGRAGDVPSGSWTESAAPRVLYTAPDESPADRAADADPRACEGGNGVLAEAPGPDDVGRHRADRAPAQCVQDRMRIAVGELRFVRERPSSLVDHLAYARFGEWTTQDDGQRRTAALMWAYLVAIPVTAVAHFTVWAVARPTRAAVVGALAAVLATALNQIPVLELLVPDGASLTAWPPFSWL